MKKETKKYHDWVGEALDMSIGLTLIAVFVFLGIGIERYRHQCPDAQVLNGYNIETCNRLFDWYDQCLEIAGSHYENYVMDVYAEGDDYEMFKEDYEQYLAARDSIRNMWESNH